MEFRASRTIRRFLGSFDRFGSTPFASLSESYVKAAYLVRIFYIVSTFKAAGYLPYLHDLAVQQPDLDLVWPLSWIEGLPLVMTADILGLANFGFAFLAYWKPGSWVFRAGFALSMLLCAAFPPSLGAVNHGDHAWLWMAICFMFLPNDASTRGGRLSYCLAFATAQGLLLAFYSMAGMWKVLFGLIALSLGVEGNFSPRGLALLLADRMVQTGTDPLLGPFLVENYILAWPMFLFLIYAQLVAVAIAFRPSLHVAWGLILIAFHTGTFLLMEIAFPNHIFLLLLLLIASPFQRPGWLQVKTIALFPGLGPISMKLLRQNPKWERRPA